MHGIETKYESFSHVERNPQLMFYALKNYCALAQATRFRRHQGRMEYYWHATSKPVAAGTFSQILSHGINTFLRFLFAVWKRTNYVCMNRRRARSNTNNNNDVIILYLKNWTMRFEFWQMGLRPILTSRLSDVDQKGKLWAGNTRRIQWKFSIL